MPQEKKDDLSEIRAFFDQFATFVSEGARELIKISDDEDEKAVIKSLFPTVNSQIKETGAYIMERGEVANRQQRADAVQAFKMSSGPQLLTNAKGIFGSLKSFIGKLGFAKIAQEVKKIFRIIMDAFGWAIPKWIETILLLIDQIVNFLTGGKSMKMQTALSVQEQNYLAEMTLHARLQRAMSVDGVDDDEDEY